MERIASGKSPIIFGDGSQSMDFVFVEDVARAFSLAVTCAASGEVFNIASGVETSLRELARTLLEAMDPNLEIEYGPERKLTAVPRRVADVSKAKARLGFEAEVTLDQGLRRLVSWWRQERQSAGADGE
jgi:UDP-glucose 4-epimerase